MTNKITIHLASPRGFCAGVDRAIEIVKKTIKKYGSPIYVRHEIVHNKNVVEDLKKQGVIFVEKLDEIKDKDRPVIFSAHGVPKSIPESAKLKKIFFIDATCPLVSKVHREAEQLNKNGFQILRMKGIPAPYPLAIKNKLISKILLKINQLMILISKSFFSYEIFAELKLKKSVEQLINEARKK